MTWRFVLIAALVAAAGATTWLLLRQPSKDSREGVSEDLPAGYYLLDAAITGTDEFGNEFYTLRARQIDHDPATDSVTLADLVFTYASDDQAGWKLDAESGHMPGDRNHIDLSGNVVISDRDASAPRSTIRTERLTVDIAARTASTDQSVRVEVDSGFLTADGLEADLENKRLNLLSNVHGEFLSASDTGER